MSVANFHTNIHGTISQKGAIFASTSITTSNLETANSLTKNTVSCDTTHSQLLHGQLSLNDKVLKFFHLHSS